MYVAYKENNVFYCSTIILFYYFDLIIRYVQLISLFKELIITIVRFFLLYLSIPNIMCFIFLLFTFNEVVVGIVAKILNQVIFIQFVLICLFDKTITIIVHIKIITRI